MQTFHEGKKMIMLSCENLCIFLTFLVLNLSSSRTCPTVGSFRGQWRQAGLRDLITINETSFSSKGICVNEQESIENTFVYLNESTRCKRCVFFISRHFNILQYRESECFDTDDDDHQRICSSITPDSVLYTLFRDNAQPIACPLLSRTWFFEKNRHSCQPKAFHSCLDRHTFRIVYNSRCSNHQDVRVQCFAQFSDGNMIYLLSQTFDQEKFICFSYGKNSLPNEIYFSKDETCRNLLSKESTIKLFIRPMKIFSSNIRIPNSIEGTWLSMNNQSISINQTHIQMTDLKILQIIQIKQRDPKIIFLRTKFFEQCSSKFICIHIIFRSAIVIDFSFDEHGCRHSSIHYTLFKSTKTNGITCPDVGIYKSLDTYRSNLSTRGCSTGIWTLAIGCQKIDRSDLILSSSCYHPIIPDVQVITSIDSICLATWRTDHRFQRTLVRYEQSKAFCLIQPLKSRTASWIFSDTSCTNLDLFSIRVDNSFQYFDTCQLSSSSSSTNFYLSFFLLLLLLLFYLTIQINI